MDLDLEYHGRCPHLMTGKENPEYCADLNLFYLREDLADELGAIIGYQECAAQTGQPRIREEFTRIANEEIGHFIRLARLIANLDPVQAQALQQQELTILTLSHESAVSALTSCGNYISSHENRPPKRRNDPGDHYGKHDFRELETLGNAIRDELKSISAYQKQVQQTANQQIQNQLIIIMNQEKEHLAKFIRLFYDFQH